MGKTQQTLLLLVGLTSVWAMAQTDVVQVQAQAEVAAETAQAQAPQGVVVVTQQQTTVPVVEQPTTIVTASPLTTSRAEQLRQARERAEIETEQKIVEKLEQSRLEDEQRRLQELFGNKPEPKQQEQVVEQQPVQVIVPLPTPAPLPQKSEEELKAEIAAQIKADLEAAKASQEKKTTWAIGAVLGTFDYPDAYNTDSDFGAGISLSWFDESNMSYELTALFSEHTVDQSYHLFSQVEQQNWMFAAKYSFLPRKISPVVGALVSYTYREYTDMYAWGYGVIPGMYSASTQSMDVGLLLGLELNAAKNVSLGLEYRWLTNIDTRYSEPQAFNRSFYHHYGRYFRPLEELDQEIVQISLKFLF